MAYVKFIILVILPISFKLYKSDIISALNVLVFKDLDLVNYNINKLFKAIKNKYLLITIILINSKKYIVVLR